MRFCYRCSSPRRFVCALFLGGAVRAFAVDRQGVALDGKSGVTGQSFLQRGQRTAVDAYTRVAAGADEIMSVPAGEGIPHNAVAEGVAVQEIFRAEALEISVHGGESHRRLLSAKAGINLLRAQRLGAFFQHAQNSGALPCVFHCSLLLSAASGMNSASIIPAFLNFANLPRVSARCRPVPLPAAVPCLCLPPPCVFAAFAPCLCPPSPRASACRRPHAFACRVRTLHASPQCAKINTAVFSVRSASQPSVSGAGAAAGGFANGPSDRPAAGNPRTQVLLAGHARAGRFGLASGKGLSFPYFSHRKEGIL